MMRLTVVALTVGAFAAAVAQHPAPGAAIDLTGFRYSRTIPAGDGLTSLVLDPAAMAHGGLNDIRIVDGKRRQVPYLVEGAGDPLEVPLPKVMTVNSPASIDPRLPGDAARRSWYSVRLPYAGLPDATLRLATASRVFRRDVAIVENLPRDTPPGASPLVAHASWSHDDPATAAIPLDIPLPTRLRGDSLFLLIDDGDNPKLSLTDASLRIPTYRLRFFRDSSEALRLVYGQDGLSAPRYDLALVADKLRDSTATAVALGPETEATDPARGVPGYIFWIALGGTVLILLALIAKLVSGDKEPDARTKPVT